ncbi:MAG: cadherin repeat domain-containing protein, partial [Bacteroidota bacterium]
MMKCHLRKAIKQSGRFLTNLGKFSLIIALFTVCGGKDDSNDLLIAEAFVTTIESELPIGTTFGAVSVTNRTGLLLTFELESENPEGAITIDPNSG